MPACLVRPIHPEAIVRRRGAGAGRALAGLAASRLPNERPLLRVAAEEKPASDHRGRPEDCMFLSELQGRIVAMVRLEHEGRHAVRIRQLRVDPMWQHTAVLTKLLRQVHQYCRQNDYFRVLLEAGGAPPWMATLLEGWGFRLRRRMSVTGREVLEFDVCRDPHTHCEEARQVGAPSSAAV